MHDLFHFDAASLPCPLWVCGNFSRLSLKIGSVAQSGDAFDVSSLTFQGQELGPGMLSNTNEDTDPAGS
jgi:hypothetical protein